MKRYLFIPIIIVIIGSYFLLKPSSPTPNDHQMPQQISLSTSYEEDFIAFKKSDLFQHIEFQTIKAPTLVNDIVYIPDLQDHTIKEQVLSYLDEGRRLCFLGHTTIGELEEILGQDLSHTFYWYQPQDGEHALGFGEMTANFTQVSDSCLLEDDLSFDLLLYQNSGEQLLFASMKQDDKDYLNLLLCVFNEFNQRSSDFPQTYTHNVQIRYYTDVQKNVYLAYEPSLYQVVSSEQCAYHYIPYFYFNQKGKELTLNMNITHPDIQLLGFLNGDGQQCISQYTIPMFDRPYTIHIPHSYMTGQRNDTRTGCSTQFNIDKGHYDQKTAIQGYYYLVTYHDLTLQELLSSLQLDIDFKVDSN